MIHVTTSGFSFKDWKGAVYPETLKPGDYLSYYNKTLGLNMVEINATYYTFLSPRSTVSWIKNTNDDFKFIIKTHKDITKNESKEYPLKSIERHTVTKFLDSVSVINETGRLLGFLAQFGPRFTRCDEHENYLKKLRALTGDISLLIEFRHPSWLLPEVSDYIFNFLKNNNLGYVAADLPNIQGLPQLVPKTVGDIGYLRFHGHNKNWFGTGVSERYNYKYNESQLKSFVPILREMDRMAKTTIAAFNNCHDGHALQNSLRLRGLLTEE